MIPPSIVPCYKTKISQLLNCFWLSLDRTINIVNVCQHRYKLQPCFIVAYVSWFITITANCVAGSHYSSHHPVLENYRLVKLALLSTPLLQWAKKLDQNMVSINNLHYEVQLITPRGCSDRHLLGLLITDEKH